MDLRTFEQLKLRSLRQNEIKDIRYTKHYGGGQEVFTEYKIKVKPILKHKYTNVLFSIFIVREPLEAASRICSVRTNPGEIPTIEMLTFSLLNSSAIS